MSVTAVVLAGGRSTRLGRDKSLETIFGETLINRVLNHVRSISTEILVVISRRQTGDDRLRYPGTRIAVDLYPDKGSLGGLYTGLKLASSPYSLVVACDMPFLNVPLLRHMIDVAPAFDVVIPRVGDLIEPLHAIYSRNCLGPIEKQIKECDLRVSMFIKSLRVKYIEGDEIDRFDPEHLSFFNINTEADLEKARLIATRDKSEETNWRRAAI